YVFREAHYRAKHIENLGKAGPSRSMSPARVTQQRRQNRRIGWDDRAMTGAAAICGLEVSQLGYGRIGRGRASSTWHDPVLVELQQVVFSVRGEVDFRIGDVVQVCLEEESRAITVAAQHLSERAAHDDVIIRGAQLPQGVFAGCGRGLVRDDRAAAEDWGIGDHNGLGRGDDIPVKDLLDRQRVHRVTVVGDCEPAVNVSHAERVGSDAPTRVGIAGRVVAGRYRRVVRAATGKTYCY